MNFGLVRGICGSLIRPDGDGDVRSRTGSRPDLNFLVDSSAQNANRTLFAEAETVLRLYQFWLDRRRFGRLVFLLFPLRCWR